MTTSLMATTADGYAGADFSADRLYRYRLWRRWSPFGGSLGFIMLNPSKADARQDDPTVRVCAGRARLFMYGGIVVGNLYGWIATEPDDLRGVADIVGRDNDEHLRRMASCKDIVLAWGAHADPARAAAVIALLCALPQSPTLYHLGLTRTGMPRHPLRVPYSTPLSKWKPAV